MNTTITLKVVQTSEPTVTINEAIEEAYGEFDRIVRQYTRFNENSELSNLNRQNGAWVQVTDEFFELITKMLELAKETEGAFDPTIIDFLEIYGYDKNYDFSKLENPRLDQIVKERVANRPSWREIELRPEAKEVKLAKDQRLDLGGIGKGYAIDCAYNKMYEKHEVKNFLIDAGGDIRVSGTNVEDKKWRVGLKVMKEREGKLEPEIAGEVELDSGQALASSGSWARKVKQFHHLINPITGKPHNPNYSTVFVLAPTATEADAWGTALFIGGEEVEKKIKYKFLKF